MKTILPSGLQSSPRTLLEQLLMTPCFGLNTVFLTKFINNFKLNGMITDIIIICLLHNTSAQLYTRYTNHVYIVIDDVLDDAKNIKIICFQRQILYTCFLY